MTRFARENSRSFVGLIDQPHGACAVVHTDRWRCASSPVVERVAPENFWTSRYFRKGSQGDIEAPPPSVCFAPKSRRRLGALECQFSANSGSHPAARTRWASPLLVLCFARWGGRDVAARRNDTRTRPIEVVPQHKIEIGVTHWNGDC
jgi:hypothetical protein